MIGTFRDGSGPFPSRGDAWNRHAPASLRGLRRTQHRRMVAGVCSGLGRYLGVDPIFFRIAFVALFLGAGSGALLYGLAWLLIPRERSGEYIERDAPTRGLAAPVVIGTALVVVGSILLLRHVFGWLSMSYLWPVVIIALGVAVIAQRRN